MQILCTTEGTNGREERQKEKRKKKKEKMNLPPNPDRGGTFASAFELEKAGPNPKHEHTCVNGANGDRARDEA